MKVIVYIYFLFMPWVSFAQTADLTIEIKGIEPVEGYLQIGIYNEAEGFPEVDKEYRVERLEVKDKKMIYRLEGLPLGDYAIAVYHDQNADGALNMNWLGIPQEPYGFSNDAKPVLSAPSFEKASFTLSGNTQVSITLID